ncbi:hypothetical protein V1634_34870 [Plantactinospora veratri]|uniref:Uncharacterized protein n=1 Tax=Plantactinospora veratri TaxID=1436122 RepID=A0ABU7SPV4_9ACTN
MTDTRTDNQIGGSTTGASARDPYAPARSPSALTRDRALGLVQGLLADGIISPTDLRAYVPEVADPFDPESLRQDYETWFRANGIETVTGRKFSLGPCPYTAEELMQAKADGWIPVVSPKGLSLTETARTFHCDTWATSDPLVTAPAEEEDLWFLTPGDLVPQDANVSARELRQRYDKDGSLGLSLQRYIILTARLRHLTGQAPDFRWWVWIMRGRYDRSGFMIAGFDPNNRFSVHAWMPQFRASFVGARPIRICPRIAGPSDHNTAG